MLNFRKLSCGHEYKVDGCGGEGGLKGLVCHKELINEINSPRISYIQNLYISVFDIAILLHKQKKNVIFVVLKIALHALCTEFLW